MARLRLLHLTMAIGYHLPLTYGLLSEKTQAHYTALFQAIEDFGPFTPLTIHCDFESAIHNVVRSVWPQTNVKGCYFHFKQALFSNLQTSALATEYNVRESPIRRYFNLIGCLLFVPAQYVQEIWSYLQPQLPLDLQDFADYCQRKWIGTPYIPP